METDLKLVKAVLDVVKESLPEDCDEIIEKVSKRIVKDLKDKGAERAMMEWYGITEEDLKMIR
ncbi:hypothetical protein [Sulfuracidifex tepidarius]|uniref:Uncharacterized protein n=1 Tax=Sulfuracidifex tepidarius TaxID=1294262 RepID=A0A510DYL0_9CREN|nr:hypothetical protein [Sulfuracidifex tepidarius]BBG25301.1 hypothetical protein IC006_2636 [Sulfuracidifex tepidarius]BBG28095.1 hypothetical protein IC007_2650 [Sulfuracidifex tepidarius]